MAQYGPSASETYFETLPSCSLNDQDYCILIPISETNRTTGNDAQYSGCVQRHLEV
jgi:hypothetical protein